MPEIKRTFQSSKMNKDMDERLVPTGEYKDALNIEVNTSEASNVGTAQSILGNTVLTSAVPTGSLCVGSIADPKTDKMYWMVAGATKTTTSESFSLHIKKDYVLEYNVQDASYKYVLVDLYEVKTTCTNVGHITSGSYDHLHVIDGGNATANITGIRIGMNVTGTFRDPASADVRVVALEDNITVTDIQKDTGTPSDWRIYTSESLYSEVDDEVTFSSDRLLKFDSTRLITGINILDGMLFWTDNYSEPKKINIERSIAGTGGTVRLNGAPITGYGNFTAGNNTAKLLFTGDTDNFHTRLVSSINGVDLEVMTGRLKQRAIWLKEEHVTVLRKAPHTPPYLKMSSTEVQRENSSGVANSIASPRTAFAFSNNGQALVVGAGPYSITFDNAVDFRVGDSILLTSDPNANPDTFTNAEVRIVIESVPTGTLPFNGPYGYYLLSINSNLGTSPLNWLARLERSKSLFEFKFPRFAYRYKYKDGEYSTISPWSEIAFLPGDYDYAPKKGYNLGMVNQLRSLIITDYIVEDATRGSDVVEVDILYKNEDSPNIYTVKTIKPTDEHPVWPDKSVNSQARTRGQYSIETELIHAMLPTDQLIRPWDNVPIKAKAQDITANRLIYGNYVQNYNITYNAKDGERQITPDIQVGLQSTLGDLANSVTDASPVPSKSVKSLRTYQVGVVYRDKLGRETPVLAGNAIDSTVTIDKKESKKFNKLTAQLNSPAPYWADSWKFFVKETASEYYSLAMDRWYEAKDGNIWISFPSSERNKIQIEAKDRGSDNTILILKKQHTTDLAVEADSRYKVIAIENEAPEYITRNTKIIGKLINSTSGAQAISPTIGGFPFVDFDSFQCNGTDFKEEFIQAGIDDTTGEQKLDMSLRESMHSGFLYARFGSGLVKSGFYKVANMIETVGGVMEIKIDGKFGEDTNFLSPPQTVAGIVGGVYVELATKIPEKRAEFDGKFFVKILNDIHLKENILSYSSDAAEYLVVDALSASYVNYDQVEPHNTASNLSLVSVNPGGNDATFHLHTAIGSSDGIINNYFHGIGGTKHKQAARSWWRSFGAGWFIDSAITANEETGSGTYGPTTTGGKLGTLGSNNVSTNPQPFASDIESGTHGIFNAGTADVLVPPLWTGNTDVDSAGNSLPIGEGTAISLSWSGIYTKGKNYPTDGILLENHPLLPLNDDNNHRDILNIPPNYLGWLDKPADYNVGVTSHVEQAGVISLLQTEGTIFRFPQDPEETIYHIRKSYRYERKLNYDANDTDGAGSFEDAANKRLNFKLVVSDVDGNGIGNKGGSGDSYHPYDHTNKPPTASWGDVVSSSSPIRIDFLTAYNPDGAKEPSDNPAVWETEPKENIALDIYYEASPAYPVKIKAETNEQYAKYGSIVKNETTPWTTTGVTATDWSSTNLTIDSAQVVTDLDVISFEAPDGGVTRLVANADSAGTIVSFASDTHSNIVTLPYSNCYAFQNGVESNRIRDDYNEIYIKNGVKASAVLAKHYEQERRGSGLIHSGIYNSTSGTNELNQFIQGNPITKDLNPRHGSIQKLLNRNTDIVAITEDKCFKILANKDALYNADGNASIITSSKVLGSATAFAGDFGTINPESFAQDNYRSYFVDRTRGKVCRLSMDGVTPISSAGMHDWFADNLQVGTSTKKNSIGNVVGSFDSKKQLYNVTLTQTADSIEGNGYESPVDTQYTVSYSEMSKGWVSFKSFFQESGLSINNDYYTFKDGELWKHHTNEIRNNFYGVQYDSSVTVMFNDQPASVKSFNTVNYEGSQAKITQHKLTSNVTDANGASVSQQDGEYYNLNSKAGWYVDSFNTNEQEGTIPEFIEKEGKWFNYIRGIATTHTNDSSSLAITSSNLDQQEFSVQGVGIPSAVTTSGIENNIYKFKVTNNTSTSYETDGGSGGTDWDATAD